MNLTATQGSIESSSADTIIVNLFEGVSLPGGATGAVDRALDGAISELIQSGDLHGKLGEVAVLYPRGQIPARRVLVAGLGKSSEFDLEIARRASAHAVKKARELGARHVATIAHGAGIGGLDPEKAALATYEGAALGLYKAPKQGQEPWDVIETLEIVEHDASRLPAFERAVQTANATIPAVFLVRDLVSWGPNRVTPTYLAETARGIAQQYGMQITIGDREWAAERKMGAFLGVAQAAKQPPAFIVLDYNADRPELDTIVLVGKGITFDSGGISLKPGERMEEMKSDMAGAAVVIATMQAIAQLQMPLHVVAIAPCTENMPGGGAYHPADILTASNGKTIEIINTDAEGRLILADALVYAAQYKPKAVVDLATLTGACVIALGEWTAAGIFSTDDRLRDRLLQSAEQTHERLWPMPLYPEYKQSIASIVADVANTGGRFGGVGTSAIFLKEFTDYPWAHLDIAGMVLISKPKETPYTPRGATGYGVRLLVDFLRNWK